MQKTISKLWNGRKIKEQKIFSPGDAGTGLYTAQRWLKENGYSYGSMCRDEPITIQKGAYTLPLKWKNLDKEDKQMMDGVLLKTFKLNEWEVILFEDKTVL